MDKSGSIKGIFLPFIFIGLVFFSCDKQQEVTYSGNIAPLIYKNCTPCHRTGEAGPFPLVTYKEIKDKSKLIAAVITNRSMPPWPADASYSHFADEKVLSDNEIQQVKQWIKAGCPIGDSTAIPEPPVSRNGSNLGKPDLVIRFPKPIEIKGDQQDHFFILKLPYEIPKDTFISTIEFVPDNKRYLHHMNGNMVQFDPQKKKNVNTGDWIFEETPGYESHDMHKKIGLLHDDDSYPLLVKSVVNYLPGVYSDQLPEGMGGYRMSRKGAFYINSMHFGPTKTDTTDNSYFNIFFAPRPPQRPVTDLILGTLGVAPVVPPLVIEPNRVKTFRTQLKTGRDISLVTVCPHMHLIGQSFLAYAIKPDGDTIPIIRINKWDFRWQYFYKFKKLLKIPAGSVIYAEGVFDNTVNNPNNPFYPPQVISEREGSMRTSDEMFQLILTYTPYQEGDENISLETKH